jgi:hypothetical protein
MESIAISAIFRSYNSVKLRVYEKNPPFKQLKKGGLPPEWRNGPAQDVWGESGLQEQRTRPKRQKPPWSDVFNPTGGGIHAELHRDEKNREPRRTIVASDVGIGTHD